VVLYDRLIGERIMTLVRRDAERIYVGKKRQEHTMSQDEISALMVTLAKAGRRVLRLKGGDPFIFGRGGEEIDTLAAEGIPFQVVPGVTAAAGCASYAGIPLTHRDHAQSVVFVTGHMRDGRLELNWPALAQPRQTIVFYMGLLAVDQLCAQLVAHGLPAAMPAALVQEGTTPRQRVLAGTLETLPALVRESGAHAPTLIIIGEVVKLRERLKWFEPAA
jgi:uroporphyrin-III C-methyltransferase/precorrin-2 dehydrogenase/sirohydrochlorin ferrochelatase